ncbi:CBS domain-containing protein [Mesobacterium pallidum]|uniref:CBS domain-containing protein n=1 Tax=Mesobacterium pallidum TaxID=2872037 RepID=UPI001EE1FAB9|nr:CBS domain-containing protein [Mesobacterium pallidum]
MAEREIAAILTRDVLRLAPETPMREAIARLTASGQPLACICDGTGELLGVLSPKDCFGAALNASYYRQWSGTVQDHMSQAVVGLPADLDIIAAAETFQSQPFRAYPVTEAGRLVGLLTREDLLRAFLDLG